METKHQRFLAKFWREDIVLLVLLPVILFFNFYNLANYPVTSGWDEGIYLQFSRNLALHGIYGSTDGDHFHVLTPTGGSGPIVIVLIGMIFKSFGQSLLNARLVMACFLFLATVSLYILIRLISRWEIALASIFLFLVAGYETYDTYWLGRQVLSEIPALFFLFLGYLFLLKSFQRNRIANLLVAMILLGAAVVTKNQLIWILVPSLGMMTVLDLYYYRQKYWWHFGAALISIIIFYFLWLSVSLIMVGSERAFFLEAQNSVFKALYLHINLMRVLNMGKMFIKSGFFIPITIAWIYTLFATRKKDSQGLIRAFFLSTAGVGLFCSLALSIPWPRLLYMGIVLSIPVIALFLADIMKYLQNHPVPIKRYSTLAVYLGLAIFTFVKLYFDARLILRTQDHSAEEFAQVVDRIVLDNEHILNWDWEVEFYSQRTFIHPDFRLFPAILNHAYNFVEVPILYEPRIPDEIHYVGIGPFTSGFLIFNNELEQRHGVIIHQIGDYALYFIP